jgi:hypothetical protein
MRLPFFHGWIIIAVTFVTMVIGVNARTAFSLFYPLIISEFGWERGVTAGAFSFGFVVSGVVSPLIGHMMDRFGPRAVMELRGMAIGIAFAGVGVGSVTLHKANASATLGRRNSDRPLQIGDRAQKTVGWRGLRIDQAVQAEAVFQCEHDRGGPGRVQSRVPAAVPQRGLDDVSDELSPGAQPLGKFGPALFGACHEQDHLHVQKRRAAERILPATVHVPQRIDEVREVLVPGEQIEIASDRLLDMVLDHGDDQLVLAVEIRIERPAREAGRRRNRLDAGAPDALLLEHARRSLEQLFAGVVPGRSGANS